MRVPQWRHLPRNISQPRIGRLSYQARLVPQAPQRLGGVTMERPRGSRWMTTPRKEPAQAPRTKATSRAAIIWPSSPGGW